MNKTLWLVPLLPMAGFLVNVFLGRFLNKLVSGAIACATVAGSAVIAWMAFFEVRAHGAMSTTAVDWFFVGRALEGYLPLGFHVDHVLRVDQLTSVMMLVITNVGFLIHLYSTGYMAEEKRYSRYFSYLNLFTGFMLVLVMSGNLIGMFVGWEGVGLCSYLLIGFWFEKVENASAGMKAFVVNRIGDLAFTVGLMLLFTYIGRTFGVWTVDVAELKATMAQHASLLDTGILTAAGILMFIGATGKSAQIPLFVWLPDAMAGPTPVSALIHAATMVTAGVYMIARMNFVYSAAPWALTVIALVGGATALFAGTIGVAQNDIKKVLAYSTVSQLGFMFMGVGVGAYFAGVFHLMTHAFFKACLFLGSGSVIHGMGGEQDIRKMGGLKKYMPITFWTFTIASVAIAGIPPFAGFFSKDEILWKAFSTTHLAVPGIGKLIWLMGITAAAFTAFYMTRLVIKTFFGELRSTPAAGHGHGHDDKHDDPSTALGASHGHGHKDDHGHDAKADDHGHGHGTPHESPATMWIPLVVLAVLSVGAGFLGMPHWAPGGGVFEKWLEPVCPEPPEVHAAAPAHEHGSEHGGEAPQHGPEAMELVLMVFSVAVAAGAIALAWKIYMKGKGAAAEKFAANHKELYELVRDKYRVDEFYDRAVVKPLLATNETLAQFDAIVVDGAVNGAGEAGVAAALGSGTFDNEIVDGAVNATGRAVQAMGRSTRKIQSGNIRSYIAASVVGGLFMIAFYCLYVMQRDGVLQGFLKR